MVKRCIKEGDDFKMKKFTPDEAPEVSFPFNECNKNKEKKNRDESKRQKLPGKNLLYSFAPPPASISCSLLTFLMHGYLCPRPNCYRNL